MLRGLFLYFCQTLNDDIDGSLTKLRSDRCVARNQTKENRSVEEIDRLLKRRIGSDLSDRDGSPEYRQALTPVIEDDLIPKCFKQLSAMFYGCEHFHDLITFVRRRSSNDPLNLPTQIVQR